MKWSCEVDVLVKQETMEEKEGWGTKSGGKFTMKSKGSQSEWLLIYEVSEK